MKKVGSFCKIFSSCIFSLYLFISCETTSAQKNYTDNGCGGIIHKPTRNIRIQNDEISPDKIKLIDEVGCPAYTLYVLPGQDVEWIIDGSIIKSIDSIVPKAKPGNGNVFEKPPHKQFFSKHWKGTGIKNDGRQYEEYYIAWTDKAGQKNKYDPLIQLNPKFDSAIKK
jgi:hypothetical protein